MFANTVGLHAVRRTIAWKGTEYQFLRPAINEYKEQVAEEDETITVNGMFYESSASHIAITNSEAASIVTKDAPNVLSTWENAQNVKKGDKVTINEKVYSVNGVTNIQEYNLVGIISLEVVL